jgi:hypothetical protein
MQASLGDQLAFLERPNTIDASLWIYRTFKVADPPKHHHKQAFDPVIIDGLVIHKSKGRHGMRTWRRQRDTRCWLAHARRP